MSERTKNGKGRIVRRLFGLLLLSCGLLAGLLIANGVKKNNIAQSDYIITEQEENQYIEPELPPEEIPEGHLSTYEPADTKTTEEETVRTAPEKKEANTSAESIASGDEYFRQKKYDDALDCYKAAYDMGDIQGANRLGEAYIMLGDDELAELWFEVAAATIPTAKYNLGVLSDSILDGSFVSVKYYREAGEMGCPQAYYNLGWIIELIQHNHDEALEIYKKGAELGDGSCMYRVGHFYDKGLGTEKDPEEAQKWYNMAAATGYVPPEDDHIDDRYGYAISFDYK